MFKRWRTWNRLCERKIKVSFAWYDMWIGIYYDRKQRIVYICPVPMLLIEIPLMPNGKLVGVSEYRR
jgi:hypothetical protein